MPADSFTDRLIGLLELVCLWVGRAVAWLTLAMVLVTFLVVMLRYLLDSGYIWMQESVTWMHGLVFMLAAAYTLQHDEHVRVDIFYRRLGTRGRAWVNLLGTLFLLMPTALFIFYTSLDFVARSWRVGESSAEAGGLPALYLLKTVIPLAAVLLLLQGLALALKSVRAIRHPDEYEEAVREPPAGSV